MQTDPKDQEPGSLQTEKMWFFLPYASYNRIPKKSKRLSRSVVSFKSGDSASFP